jgi:hypothetical protein
MRSNAVSIGIVSAVALALTSCSSQDEPDLRCVDTQTFKTVSDTYCAAEVGEGYATTDRYQWYQDDGSTSGTSAGNGTDHYHGHRYSGHDRSHSSVHKGGFGGHGKSSGG